MKQRFNSTKILLKKLGTFFAANAAKNRAFRFKSSDLPMQILWAFRCNPLRGWQLRTGPRNCRWQFRERIIAAGNYAHRTQAAAILQNCVMCHQARSEAKRTYLSPAGCYNSSGGPQNRVRDFAANPITQPQTGAFFRGIRRYFFVIVNCCKWNTIHGTP
ncbi:MAG: hypothetical protein LBK13_04040 [Spirochaetales bacterium]|jgi:hypothetical protein|nr:hypothetical protein [Spirochaetales bacterium]